MPGWRSAAPLLLTLGLLVTGRPTLAQWLAEGPGPITGGQVEGIVNGEVVGAINAVVAHPSNAAILYVGAVNGGIWKSINATSASPSWAHQTDDAPSLSIGALKLDPTDLTHQTLLAGIGLFSSLGSSGGSRAGLLRTVNGGASWTVIDGGMSGRGIIGVAPRGSTLVAAVNVANPFTCGQLGIWRSTNTGASWTQITSGIPRGAADVLASDPTDVDILYTSIVFGNACDGGGASNGIYKSTDQGATWAKVSTPAMDVLLTDSTQSHVEIAVGMNDNVFVALVPSTTRRLGGVFRSGDGGGSWTAMDLPTTFEDTASVGLHPGAQGDAHLSIAADPSDHNVVYVGGDRQPLSFNDTSSFPNSIGAMDFSGRLFRGDAGLMPGSQWIPLTHSGTQSNSAPHADSRDMTFDAAGNLIEVDDGGIYKRPSPGSATGDWLTINGDIQTTELHDTAYDPISDILIGGAQDTGTPQQMTPSGLNWDEVHSADGGDVGVDFSSTPGMSIRYSSLQNLASFRRRTYNASNVLQSQTFPPLNVVSGPPLAVQFITPLAVNNVDGTRLIIGGANSVYESLDQGDTLSEIGPGIFTLSFGRNTMAYGATGNADVIYVGGCIGNCIADDNDGVYVRGTGGGPLAHSLSPSGGDIIQGLAIDPSDPAQAFAMDTTTVYRTANTGASWSDITANLPITALGPLRAVEYLNRASGDMVVVAGDRGVYAAEAGDNFSFWYHLGSGLPNAPVFDLDYAPGSDKLFAGTLGRGAFSLQPTTGFGPFFVDGFENGNTSMWSAAAP